MNRPMRPHHRPFGIPVLHVLDERFSQRHPTAELVEHLEQIRDRSVDCDRAGRELQAEQEQVAVQRIAMHPNGARPDVAAVAKKVGGL